MTDVMTDETRTLISEGQCVTIKGQTPLGPQYCANDTEDGQTHCDDCLTHGQQDGPMHPPPSFHAVPPRDTEPRSEPVSAGVDWRQIIEDIGAEIGRPAWLVAAALTVAGGFGLAKLVNNWTIMFTVPLTMLFFVAAMEAVAYVIARASRPATITGTDEAGDGEGGES